MNATQFIALIKQKAGVIILAGIFVAALSFLGAVVTQKNFKVSTDFLVVQNQNGPQDYYSLSKSAEYLGNVLSESIYSELFIDEVVKTQKVNQEFLPFDKKDRLKTWSRMINVKRNSQLGILSVEVLGNDQRETLAVAEGISEVLAKKSYLFRGSGQNIDVRVLSGPIAEKNPSFSIIILVILAGFIIGILVAFVWTYYSVSVAKIFFERTDYEAPGPKLT
ncbi:MAG: hypothetical protein NT136_03270, partial [Candidatus Moranbacteria bacterium]|nr:hypothetical protein [Candidatus Moranbacteria bacterium]